MPIDARIPLQGHLPDPNGFTNALAKGFQLRRYQQESEAAAREEELAETNRNALRDYGASGRTPEDLNALWGAAPELAAGIEKTQGAAALNTAKIGKEASLAKKAELEVAAQKLDVAGRLLSSVRDDASYQQVRAEAPTYGLDVSRWPDKYFPDFIEQSKARGLKMKDAVDLQLREFTAASQDEHRDATRDETARYHDATLAGQEAGRAETVRSHMVNEARPRNGITMTTDADGRPIVQVGGSPAPFGKPAVNMLEETQIKGTEALARLDEIERVAKPELLTYGNKVRDAALDVKSKLGGEMSPDQQKFRNETTDMRQSTMDHLNRTIKDQTGATITVQEVPRIAATVPTMDDAPDQFPRKLKNATRLTRNAIIRAQIAREQGMDPLQTGIDLGDTKTLMNQRGEQLKRHYAGRAPGMKPAEVDAAIEKQLRQEFGY